MSESNQNSISHVHIDDLRNKTIYVEVNKKPPSVNNTTVPTVIACTSRSNPLDKIQVMTTDNEIKGFSLTPKQYVQLVQEGSLPRMQSIYNKMAQLAQKDDSHEHIRIHMFGMKKSDLKLD